LELGWRRENVVDLTEADYFEMVLKKTLGTRILNAPGA